MRMIITCLELSCIKVEIFGKDLSGQHKLVSRLCYQLLKGGYYLYSVINSFVATYALL